MHNYSFTRIAAAAKNGHLRHVEPSVSINSYGNAYLNRPALELLDFSGNAAEVLVDLKAGVLALRPVAQGTPGSYAFGKKKKSGSGTLYIERPVSQFGKRVPQGYTLRFVGSDIEVLPRENLLVLNIGRAEPEPSQAVSQGKSAWPLAVAAPPAPVKSKPPLVPNEFEKPVDNKPKITQAETDVPASYYDEQLALCDAFKAALAKNAHAQPPDALDRDLARFTRLLATAQALAVSLPLGKDEQGQQAFGLPMQNRIKTVERAMQDRLSALAAG